jgi:hypothetical protein
MLQNEEDEIRAEIEADHESEWEPDEQATQHPSDYRINTWDKTHLGSSTTAAIQFIP